MRQIDTLELYFQERKEPTPGRGWTVPEHIYRAAVNDRKFTISIACNDTNCWASIGEQESYDPETGSSVQVGRAGSTYATHEEALADMTASLVRGVATGIWLPRPPVPIDWSKALDDLKALRELKDKDKDKE